MVKFSLTLALFTIICMVVGIIVVRTTSKKPVEICLSIYHRTVISPIGYDTRPRSVALGDLDQQNQLDIVIANSGQDNIGILLQGNNGTVIKQTTYPTGTGSYPIFVTVNDFNNDSLLDIAVANYGTNNIGIFLGLGKGIFTNQTIFSTGNSHSLFITVGDLNNDDRQDIVVVHYGTNDIGIFLGYGNGSFANETNYSTGYNLTPYSLALADLNNDQYLDMVVANSCTDEIIIFMGFGHGIFTDSIRYTTTVGSRPSSIVITDLNNDHQLDLVVANYGLHSLGIFFGYGNGSFATMVPYFMGDNSRPIEVTVSDLNLDNYSDIIVVNSEGNNIYILFGNGNGSFPTTTIYSTGFGSLPHAVTITDINNDKIPDMVIVNVGASEVLFVQGYGNGTFGNETSYELGYNFDPYAVAVGHFTEDNWIDIVIANYGGNNVETLLRTC